MFIAADDGTRGGRAETSDLTRISAHLIERKAKSRQPDARKLAMTV
jgi:hypothetical protein